MLVVLFCFVFFSWLLYQTLVFLLLAANWNEFHTHTHIWFMHFSGFLLLLCVFLVAFMYDDGWRVEAAVERRREQ
jgi:hypothetical protein